jgi:hypothetical protein
MSTVSKDIADRVIAGEFEEDGIHTIIKYNNIFDGREAYKLLYGNMSIKDTDFSFMMNPTVYWKKETEGEQK